jgi:hypothetical protein
MSQDEVDAAAYQPMLSELRDDPGAPIGLRAAARAALVRLGPHGR